MLAALRVLYGDAFNTPTGWPGSGNGPSLAWLVGGGRLVALVVCEREWLA